MQGILATMKKMDLDEVTDVADAIIQSVTPGLSVYVTNSPAVADKDDRYEQLENYFPG